MLVKFMLFVEVMDHIWMGREARAGKLIKSESYTGAGTD